VEIETAESTARTWAPPMWTMQSMGDAIFWPEPSNGGECGRALEDEEERTGKWIIVWKAEYISVTIL
jgi:hypothetical protein